MTPPADAMLRIGDLRVDPTLDEICKDGKITKLEPRTMRLLVCLAQHPGEVLSVEQLLTEVWRDVVVGQDSVYQAVAGLRRILGDDPKAPVYIANVMRRGYRLVAPVAPWSEPSLNISPSSALETPALSKTEPVPGPPLPDETSPQQPPPALPPEVGRAPRRASPIGRWSLAAVILLALGLGALLGRQAWKARHASAVIADKSVAVLPFLDLSEKHDEEYFADGMSEELIDVLARVPDLRVPARTSSFYFKGKQATLPDIAKALGVSHVLEGSVRKSGDTLRITAQLIRVDTGYHEWSETFDRPIADVFKVQDEIASEVVRVLKISLLGMHRAPAPTANGAAYALYLRARGLELGGNPDDFVLAEKYIQQSLALDPTFAPAWADLAQIIVADEGWSSRTSYVQTCTRGRKAIDEALKLSGASSDSHRVLANVLYNCDWNWNGAEGEYQRALALDPGNAETLRQYATLAWSIKRPQQAIDLAQKAVLRDPLDSWNYHTLALAQNEAGRIEDSIASWRKALDLDPTVGLYIALLANAYLADGKPAEALSTIEQEPIDQMKQMNLPFIYEALGRKEDATRALMSFEDHYGARDPVSLGEFYACRHEVDRAIGYLQSAVDMHFLLTDVANRQACYQPLEGDTRYRELLREMHLSE
jgi:TolB-like protein/DNA-binding winged helix-turn-helix (wHTH) protein/tetratricopeptide (TPR) repeat protein